MATRSTFTQLLAIKRAVNKATATAKAALLSRFKGDKPDTLVDTPERTRTYESIRHRSQPKLRKIRRFTG